MKLYQGITIAAAATMLAFAAPAIAQDTRPGDRDTHQGMAMPDANHDRAMHDANDRRMQNTDDRSMHRDHDRDMRMTHDMRRDHRDWGAHRGWRHHRHCRIVWRHHHRIRRCW